jgi:hypothetical protein
MVGDHFHAYVNDAFDFCGAALRTDVRSFGGKAGADEVATSDSGHAFLATDSSAKPSADTEIIGDWRAERPGPAI